MLYETPVKQIQKTDLSQICAAETSTASSIVQQSGVSLSTTQQASISLKIRKLQCITEEFMPPPFKRALFWSETKQRTLKKRKSEKIPIIATSKE